MKHNRKKINPAVSDYGGKWYGGRATVVKQNTHTTTDSLRCLDCGSLRFVRRLELYRAAKPRCLKCGGALAETIENEKRRLGTKTERKHAAAAIAASRCPLRCWSCGFGCLNSEQLAHHLDGNKDCCGDYLSDGKTVAAMVADEAEKTKLANMTAHVVRCPAGGKPWRVYAVACAIARIVMVGKKPTKLGAVTLVHDLQGDG